jgi:5-methylcytosine-specific restriction endonuclease McrA
MFPFREKTPKRRENPSNNPTGNSWAIHKPELREDFYSRCGYCDSFDGYRHTYFEVDHFIPKDFFKDLGNISLTDYKNLVYSCKFCNNSKRAKWPSQREDIFYINNEGFEDPATELYENHFYRTHDGGIMWKTELGKWMFSNAFKFGERQDSIKVLWNIDKLGLIIESLALILRKYKEDTEEYKNLRIKIGEYSYQYFLYHKELINYYG